MGYLKKSHSKIWSILKWVYKHTQTDKWVCTLTECYLLKMGVTTPRNNTHIYYVLLNFL
jgi:hypothetical protein